MCVYLSLYMCLCVCVIDICVCACVRACVCVCAWQIMAVKGVRCLSTLVVLLVAVHYSRQDPGMLGAGDRSR